MCAPVVALAPTATLAVKEVPAPLTTMFDATTFESIAPVESRNLIEVVPLRFVPVRVIVRFVPFDI
jgi:hypothetical protein